MTNGIMDKDRMPIHMMTMVVAVKDAGEDGGGGGGASSSSSSSESPCHATLELLGTTGGTYASSLLRNTEGNTGSTFLKDPTVSSDSSSVK
jgi:hypothetical protein